jgi:hypothetical protein
MPADAAGQVLPQGLPRALPGARDPTALAAAPQAPGVYDVHDKLAVTG